MPLFLLLGSSESLRLLQSLHYRTSSPNRCKHADPELSSFLFRVTVAPEADIALGSQYGTVTGVAAGAERGSGVNRHAVGEHAPAVASVIVGDEGLNGRKSLRCRSKQPRPPLPSILRCRSRKYQSVELAINQNIDWINSHTVPVTVRNSDRRTTGNTEYPGSAYPYIQSHPRKYHLLRYCR